jgi:hypothetical protein
MKGCFVLQRRFAYVGHEIALLLKEKHDIDSFCGYVHEREGYDFLKAQRNVEYTDLILDENIQKKYRTEKLDLDFLRRFEQEYGNLWKFISIDRVIRYGQLVREFPHDEASYSYEDMLRIVQVYAKHLLQFLETERPDFIFVYQPGALGTMMLVEIAKKKNIPVIYIVPPITEGLTTLSQRYDRLSWVEKKLVHDASKELHGVECYEKAHEFIRRFKEKPVVYSTVYGSLVKHGKWKQFDFLHPKHFRRTYNYSRLVFRKWNESTEIQSDYTSVRPSHYFYDRFLRKIRTIRGYDDLYSTFDKEMPYAFYALSYEPELSILLLSPFDTDQRNIIWRLARSLPAGMILYVKEHPQMTPYRPRRFYQELKKIPNVRILRPEVSSFEIMRSAQLVSTITGAVGWEASLFGKPVITFGEVFYNALPSVARSKTPEELPALVENSSIPNQEKKIRFDFFPHCSPTVSNATCSMYGKWRQIRKRKKSSCDRFRICWQRKFDWLRNTNHANPSFYSAIKKDRRRFSSKFDYFRPRIAKAWARHHRPYPFYRRQSTARRYFNRI